ncbi:MAG TPA: SURF1 family protein [Candidatus Brachybacterium merdigallinarum]|nr:SURF1 family protein [Candidatus Brachybacterium merdigallinarum]
MLRTALQPRYLGLLALMLVAALVCGLLANWQLDRATRALIARDEAAAELGDVRDVLEIGGVVTNDMVGGIATAQGTFDPDEQVLVPHRSIDGTDATLVVTALHVALEDGSTARLPVARGWLPTTELTGPDGEVDPSLAPAPPSGEIEISGRLEASEAASQGINEGIATEIATPLLVNAWGSPMYAGYLGQISPAEGLQPMPEAESEFSAGLDWQNIGYALQWVLFAAFFLYLWWRSVRTAHLDRLEDERQALRAELGEDPHTDAPGREPAPAHADAPGREPVGAAARSTADHLATDHSLDRPTPKDV